MPASQGRAFDAEIAKGRSSKHYPDFTRVSIVSAASRLLSGEVLGMEPGGGKYRLASRIERVDSLTRCNPLNVLSALNISAVSTRVPLIVGLPTTITAVPPETKVLAISLVTAPISAVYPSTSLVSDRLGVPMLEVLIEAAAMRRMGSGTRRFGRGRFINRIWANV